jgi:integrase
MTGLEAFSAGAGLLPIAAISSRGSPVNPPVGRTTLPRRLIVRPVPPLPTGASPSKPAPVTFSATVPRRISALIVGNSKTAGGEGRVIPLSETAFKTLQEWRREFPDAAPAHYVFPTERYGLAGEEGFSEGKVVPYAIDPTKPIGSWKVAWSAARTSAKVDCRWHDMRHTFVSRLAESQASDATIMSLAGHLSRKMMDRYSHTRGEAKRAAISVLDA